MQRIFLLLTLCLTAWTGVRAGTYTPDNLPLPYLQNRNRYVSNPDGLLSARTVAHIDSLLRRLEDEKGVQMLVAAMERVEGGDCYDFAFRLGNARGIGGRDDKGLILLLAAQDRCYQLLTGEGMEGTLPDALCRRIENRQFVPYLKTGDWDTALSRTVEAVCATVLADNTLMPPTDGTAAGNDDFFAIALVFLLVAGLLISVSWYRDRLQRRCPRCGKGPVKRIRVTAREDARRGRVRYTDTYRCPDCGHTFTRQRNEPSDRGTGFGGTLPPLMGWGGLRGGSGRGGGFGGGIGGSFGSGSFGGGGSGGRF